MGDINDYQMKSIEDKKKTAMDTTKLIIHGNWIFSTWIEKLIILGLMVFAVYSFMGWLF